MRQIDKYLSNTDKILGFRKQLILLVLKAYAIEPFCIFTQSNNLYNLSDNTNFKRWKIESEM